MQCKRRGNYVVVFVFLFFFLYFAVKKSKVPQAMTKCISEVGCHT